MKRVLVTGGSGYIGKELVKELLKNNIEVYILQRDKFYDLNNNSHGPLIHSIFIETDPLKIHYKFEYGEIDAAYHLAWGGSCGNKREDAFLQISNLQYSLEIVNFLNTIGCKKFIGAGSLAEKLCEKFVIGEKTKTLPIYQYGITKLATHYMTKVECEKLGISHLWTYLPNVYGEKDTTNNFISNVIKKLLKGERAAFTSGRQLDDFTYVTDVVKALVLLGQYGIDGEDYYIGRGESRTIKEFVTLIRNIVDPEAKLYFGELPDRGNSLKAEMFNASKLKSTTNFSAQITFEEGIRKTLSFEKN